MNSCSSCFSSQMLNRRRRTKLKELMESKVKDNHFSSRSVRVRPPGSALGSEVI